MKTTIIISLVFVSALACGQKMDTINLNTLTPAKEKVQYVTDVNRVYSVVYFTPKPDTFLAVLTANGGTYRFLRQDLNKMPYTNINDVVSLCPGIYQRQPGGALSINGARETGNQYVVDGMYANR